MSRICRIKIFRRHNPKPLINTCSNGKMRISVKQDCCFFHPFEILSPFRVTCVIVAGYSVVFSRRDATSGPLSLFETTSEAVTWLDPC